MKIQYMSDLHMEFAENSRYLKHNEFPVTGDVLVLAGDIFYLRNDVAPLGKFWKWASTNYRQVLIVPGNHDYYGHYDIMTRGMQWEWMFNPNRSLEKVSCHFLMTAIRKIALYMLDS